MERSVSTHSVFADASDLAPSLFQSIVEHASDAIIVVNLDGAIMLSNPAVADIFQRQRNDFQGELFGFPIASGELTEIEILRQDGLLAVAEMRVSEAYWERERVFIAILRDITERKRMETALHEAKEELAAVYRCAPLGVITLKTDGRVKLWNPAAENILGWKETEVVGNVLPNISAMLTHRHRVSGNRPLAAHDEAIKGREIQQLKKDGTPVDLSVSLASVRDVAGQAAGIVCIVEDISRRLRDAEKLRLSGKIFENTQEGILVTDAQGVILAVNQAFVAVTGYTAADAIGRKPNLLNSGLHDRSFYQEMWRLLIKDGHWRGDIWNRRKNGEIYPEWINISAIRDDDGNLSNYVAIFSDISKAKENEESLLRLAHFDALTGLPNRFLFQDHVALALAQAERNGKQVAILFLDLDHFKTINDTLGHRAGDNVLIEAAQRLAACLRAGDTLSRFGGDEFMAVLPDLDTSNGGSNDAAASVADKLLTTLARPFIVEGQEVRISTSIGIALYPQDGQQLNVLSNAADAAMYRAKQRGRNTHCFSAPGPLTENDR
jgi:diguanylate cyclase (GGDEF)-like protein/PAS domain S-box-containing protein